jgi:hypothetical protein
VDPGRLHFFDRETGLALPTRVDHLEPTRGEALTVE